MAESGSIGARLAAWQDDLDPVAPQAGSMGAGDGLSGQGGLSATGGLSAALEEEYLSRWRSPGLAAAVRIRTSLVFALQEFLVKRGLANIDRVSLSPVTDPLCHGVEHAPEISYRGVPYRTTHSMIYSKMLACMNPALAGVYIDSPNIRLELPEPAGVQRGKYLIDFSQMDIEVRRREPLSEADYFGEPERSAATLEAERDRALDFFEDMIVHAVSAIARDSGDALSALGVALEVPVKPFPRFFKDEDAEGEKGLEMRLGKKAGTQFFWVLGLLRENYDLVYPYLRADGSKPVRGEIPSRSVYNYDLCAASRMLDGKLGDAFEVLSGGLREWVYPAIVERLVDNGIIAEKPRFTAGGRLENMEALAGYGPFLAAARSRGSRGESFFPQTFGGGLGIERTLYALLRGPVVEKIEDVTFFGKNPDSSGIFLF